MEDIRDIKGLVPLPHGWWWLWLLLAFVALAVAFWLWKRRQPGVSAFVAPPPTPYEVAIRELRRLREENLPVEEFYTRLSDVVRQYLEGQMGLRAPERTTEEFLYELQETNLLTPDQKESLGEFLKRCDLVKFAKYEPGPPELHDLHDSAMRLVEETEPIMTTLQTVKAGEPA